MRIGRYIVEPDTVGWKVVTTKIMDDKESKNFGKEVATDTVWPGTFPQALRRVLDNMVKDELPENADLARAVETVAHLYATIGKAWEPTDG